MMEYFPTLLFYYSITVISFFIVSFSLFQGVFIFSLVTYKPLKYNDYEYPVWGQVLGWCVAASSMIQIPIFVVYQMATAKGTLREVSTSS